MSIFREVHERLPRQGPGSDDATRRALGLVRGLPARPRILDVGCGSGAQTIVLAESTGGEIVAVDLNGRLLDELMERARAAGVDSQIKTIEGSMFEMDFAEASFDLIWSEGAIYIAGFAAGLSTWRRFLKRGGAVVVSELSWLRPVDERPPSAVEFWAINYPGMRSIELNARIVADAGYEHLETFVLPPQDWWDNYYGPAEARVVALRAKYAGDAVSVAKLAEIQSEYDLFRKYPESYGYVFYVARRAEG